MWLRLPSLECATRQHLEDLATNRPLLYLKLKKHTPPKFTGIVCGRQGPVASAVLPIVLRPEPRARNLLGRQESFGKGLLSGLAGCRKDWFQIEMEGLKVAYEALAVGIEVALQVGTSVRQK